MARGVQESYQLEVIAGKVMVPGCEPTSYVSSRTLAYAYTHELKCGTGTVPVKKALAGIPGSYLKFGLDWNRGNTQTIFFVFPPITHECNCAPYTDWYAELRKLAAPDETVSYNYDYCNINESGFCPSPDFDNIPEPPKDPYLTEPEGAIYNGAGILPPIPPWAIKS